MDLRKGRAYLAVVLCVFSLGIFARLASAQGSTPLDPFLRGMGLTTTPVGEEFAESFCAPVEHGLLLTASGCPAQWEEFDPLLMPWDIIVECNGKKVHDLPDIILEGSEDKLKLNILRQGRFFEVLLDAQTHKVESESEPSFIYSPRNEVTRAVYYMDGESVWEKDHTLLESGSGIISGRILISGNPVEGVEISLFLAGKKKTQSATTDSDGRFQANLPPGKYYYLGYSLTGPNAPNREMVAADRKMDPFGWMDDDLPMMDGDELTNKFDELEAKYGPEKAAEMIAEEFEDDLEDPFTEKYPLNLTSGSAESIPDIVYNEPIKIVAPLHNSRVSLDRLSFAWIPYEGADFYRVRVSHIKKKGRSTHYSPVCKQTVYENYLDPAELECDLPGFTDDEDVSGLVSGERYGVRVFAYDKNGKLLTASGEHKYVEFFIK